MALPFERRYCVVDCERVDAAGTVWRWRHVLDQDTIAASVEHIREAIPGVVVTVRKDSDGKPTRNRKGMRKGAGRGDVTATKTDPVR